MDDFFTNNLTAKEAAQIQEEIRQGLEEIKQRREEMRLTQIEIERTGARTDATLQHIKAMLAERWKL